MVSTVDKLYAERLLSAFRTDFSLDRFAEDCERAKLKTYYRTATELQALSQLIVDHLARKEPFSLIRIGDGEGNILSLSLPNSDHESDMRCVDAIFQMMDGQTIPAREAVAFSGSMMNAVMSADVIGTRIYRSYDEPQTWNEVECASNACSRERVRACVGMIKAVEALRYLLANRSAKLRVVTSAWVYPHLLGDLDKFVQAADRVIVVSGRPRVRDVLARRYGSKSIAFVLVPVQASDGRLPDRAHHYPEIFNRVISLLMKNQNARGTLVLVGAGIFGKVYCGVAKASGAVALDIGSGFDLLAGLRTRGFHKKLKKETTSRSVL